LQLLYSIYQQQITSRAHTTIAITTQIRRSPLTPRRNISRASWAERILQALRVLRFMGGAATEMPFRPAGTLRTGWRREVGVTCRIHPEHNTLDNGPGCLNNNSASISGPSAAVRPPRGAEKDPSRLDPGCGRQGSNADGNRCKNRDTDQSSFAPNRLFRRLADKPPRI
jgi:hypothetical protein